MTRAACVALVMLVASAARAQAPDAGPSPPGQKRPVPDYDGRPDPGPSPEEVVAWVPRVVLFPAYLVTEFLLRRPLGWLIVSAERGNWPTEIITFFTFGGRKDLGLVPTFLIDLGFRPTVGFYFFWNEALHPRQSVRVRASVWSDGYSFSIADRWRTDEAGSRFQLRTELTLRPDLTFYGIGADALESDLSRYGLRRSVGAVSWEGRFSLGETLLIEAGVRDMSFRPSRCCDGVPLEAAPIVGLYPLPPGYPEGYFAVYERVAGTVDTRPAAPARQNGVRLALDVEHGTTIAGDGWLRASGTAGAYWDVVSMGRVLGVTVFASLVEPTSGVVPFTELVPLGGGPIMPGLRPGRLLGQSALAASIRYEWPVWIALGGTLQVEVGNVFGPRFEGFATDELRLSTAIGLKTTGDNDHAFQFLFGVGTETFSRGASLTSLRLVFGGTYGF